jgi:XTP/dITP diphosphohydrolase
MNGLRDTNRLVIATKNAGKLLEYRNFLAPLGYTLLPMSDLQEVQNNDIAEVGTTLCENALIKAKTIANVVGTPVLADDSGLFVEALGGAPGVYSARYAGEKASDALNAAKLQAELQRVVGHPQQHGAVFVWGVASFRCAVVLYSPTDDRMITAEGACHGWITDRPYGYHGFGYDPYFYVDSHRCTTAQMTVEQKQQMSHRGEAMRHLLYQMKNADHFLRYTKY